MDATDGLTFFDGTFILWPLRYAFPSLDTSAENQNEPGVHSALMYRRGDYFLDEFSFDINSLREEGGSVRFEALKRNFEDQYGLLGFPGLPGGTIQQNYRLLMKIPGESDEVWNISSAYFKTTDAVPVPSESGWEKGATRRDRIIASGLGYTRNGQQLEASAFSQRLKLESLSSAPDWSADLIAYKLRYFSSHPVGVDAQRFLRISGKYSILSSDSLDNRSRLAVAAAAGFWTQVRKYEFTMALGGAFVSPDRRGLLFDGRVDYSLTSSDTFSLTVIHWLHALPFQYSGGGVPEWPADKYNVLRSDSSAISQSRTVLQITARHRSSRMKTRVGLFGSRADPHYYFEKREYIDYRSMFAYQLDPQKMSSDGVGGVFWQTQLNYFRSWWLQGSGVSLFENKQGWGSGVQHEGSIGLLFRESLFGENLDLRVRFWTNFWVGRNSYVWDPLLKLGYYDDTVVPSQDNAAVANVEFKGVISTFEISFTMRNLLYAGRTLIRSFTGDFLTEDQLSFSATPLFPAAGRLAFVTIRWHFMN